MALTDRMVLDRQTDASPHAADRATASDAAAAPRMPSFAAGTFAHRHTLHSALVSLAALGIEPHRIQLRYSGREALPSGTVMRQRPPAGTPLLPGTPIELAIAGLGITQSLPVGMWDSGGEAAMGTRELLELFDDPLQKLGHWFHEGAPLFRISPEDPAACARWLSLFGVNAQDWPPALWYPLASLIAAMPKLACSQSGCALVLEVLLGLPVRSFSYRPAFTAAPREALSLLARRASRLGVDAVVGDRMEDLAVLVIEIGPVPLAAYTRFTEGEGAALLARTLEMVLPISTGFDLQWTVLDQRQSPRLGMAERNARLGINSHMGAPAPPAEASVGTESGVP